MGLGLFTEETLNEKFHFLRCAGWSSLNPPPD